MCFGSPKVDTTIQEQQLEEARLARQREEERTARIQEGSNRLDTQFGMFDDSFYGGRTQSYLDYYQPQLDDQFKNARDQLTYALARAGTLNSTLAADKTANLTKMYDTQRGAITSQALDATNQQRARINAEKSSLVAQLNATGDADRVSNEALARTQQMYGETPAYNPLGDIFAGVAAGIGNYVNAQNNSATYKTYFGNSGQSGGSASVIH